jgi:AcrR family transcriptional regulator
MKTATPLSSHDRILLAGKTLFARSGYESTSTVAIARQAGTSESQLMKHFGSKLGLLTAILEDGWAHILEKARSISSSPVSSPQAILDIMDSLIAELERDPEIKTLLMMESRRISTDNAADPACTGFLQFGTLLENMLDELKSQGALRSQLDVRATRAALYGMVEGLIFAQLSSQRRGADCYDAGQAREVLHRMVMGLGNEGPPRVRPIS